VFFLKGEEIEDPTVTVSGTLLVNHLYTHILFKSGATHLFLSPKFVDKLASKPDEIDIQLYMTTPLGFAYHTDIIFKNCAINVEGKILSADLVQLEIQGWDIILRMD